MQRKNVGYMHIYTWNPDWNTFQHSSIDEKVEEFFRYIQTCQDHLASIEAENTSCLIVAPDLIFDGDTDEIFSFNQKEAFERKISVIQNSLNSNTLVIAGSISYACQDEEYYKITSYILSRDKIQTYDKKEPTSYRPTYNHKLLTMQSGDKTGLIKFKGLQIGLEICQDHELQCLQRELQNKSVDIHVLLSAGQSMRPRNVVVDLDHPTIFIQCEREPGHHLAKDLESGVYQVTKQKRQWLNSPVQVQVSSNPIQTTSIAVAMSHCCVETQPKQLSSQANVTVFPKTRPMAMHPLIKSLSTLLQTIKDIVDLEAWSVMAAPSGKPTGISTIYQIIGSVAVKELTPKEIVEKLDGIKAFCRREKSGWHFFRDEKTIFYYNLLSEMNLDNERLIQQTIKTLNEIKNQIKDKIEAKSYYDEIKTSFIRFMGKI